MVHEIRTKQKAFVTGIILARFDVTTIYPDVPASIDKKGLFRLCMNRC